MCQNECFRKLNIYGTKDEIINTNDKTADWRFIDKINHCGIYRYHFANDKLGAEVLFEDCDTYFRCSNVFPLDKKNFSEPEYNKGFDSSENQAENYKDDVLYKLWKAITPKLHCKFSLSDLD